MPSAQFFYALGQVFSCCLLLAQVLVSTASAVLHHCEVTSLLSFKCLLVILLKTPLIPTRNLMRAGLPWVGPPMGWYQLRCWALVSTCFQTLAHIPLHLGSDPKAWRLILSLLGCPHYVLLCATSRLVCEDKMRNMYHSYWGTSIHCLALMYLAISFRSMFSV